MNRRSPAITCFLSLSIVVVILTQQQVFAQPNREDVEKVVTQLVKDEVEKSVELEYSLIIDEQQEFFSLDQKAVEKLEAIKKSRITDQVIRFDEGTVARMVHFGIMQLNVGNTFSLNGKEHTMEGTEREEPFMDAMVYPKNGRVYLRVQSQTLTSVQFLMTIERIRTTNDVDWVEVLEEHGKAKLSTYVEMLDERLRENALDIMFAVASEWLAISPEQEQPLRTWLEEGAEFDRAVELYENARKALLEIKELPTDLLTKDQQNSWRLMVAELKGR